MAEGVIDRLEAIEIQIEEYRRHLMALAERHGAAQGRDEATPVQCRRQHIVIRCGLRRLGPQAQGLDLGAQALDLGLGVGNGRVAHERRKLPDRRLSTSGQRSA